MLLKPWALAALAASLLTSLAYESLWTHPPSCAVFVEPG